LVTITLTSANCEAGGWEQQQAGSACEQHTPCCAALRNAWLVRRSGASSAHLAQQLPQLPQLDGRHAARGRQQHAGQAPRLLLSAGRRLARALPRHQLRLPSKRWLRRWLLGPARAVACLHGQLVLW
jgi:hypothetical protein